MNDYMSKLNPEQLSAVMKIDGPVLIVAGAGTGKTRTITSRIVHILDKGLTKPEEILAVTFTNKAANEMRSRVYELAGTKLPFLGTFHSIAAKILRCHAEQMGLVSNFVIIDMEDQLKMIKAIMKDLEVAKNIQPKAVVNVIQRWKEKCWAPSEVVLKNPQYTFHIEHTAKQVYVRYQQKLMDNNSCDFGDLLFYNVKLFQKCPDILFRYQNKFRYIMVDEYQDTNAIQYQWLKYLSKVHSNICCVGDDDQSIYSWRGAEVENILKFSDEFKCAQTVKLECNYRSTSHILLAAWHVIKKNKERLEKKLWTENGDGEKVNVKACRDENHEANFLCKQIQKLNENEKKRFSDIALLVRATFQTRAIEESFMQNGVPYKILCGVKFYERKEIKDVISYLRLIVNNNDNMAFERIINEPKRSIGDASLKKIQQYALDNKMSFIDATRDMIDKKKITGKTKTALNDFFNKIKSWEELLEEKSLKDVVETVVNESGYMEMLKKELNTGPARIENVKELVSSLNEYEDVTSFLEHISLVSDVDNMKSGNAVHIMTLHAAKGLEFPCVFLPGWEDGLMPNGRCMEESGNKGLEEERRLAYVGITRAKEKLTISYAQYRSSWNGGSSTCVSRFVQELPKDHVLQLK